MVTYPYAYMTYIVSSLAGLGGAYRIGRPPTACLVKFGHSKSNGERGDTGVKNYPQPRGPPKYSGMLSCFFGPPSAVD